MSVKRTSYGITEIKCNNCDELLYNIEILREFKEIDLGYQTVLKTKLELNSFSNFNMICKCKTCGSECEL